MSRRITSLALLAGIGLALGLSARALAYGPQVPHTITVTPAQSTFVCGDPTAVSATVLDQDAKPITGVTIAWSLTTSPSSGDRTTPTTSTTDAQGVARTMLTLACVAGDRVIQASAGGISGTAVIRVQIDRGSSPPGIRLPDTTTSVEAAAPAPAGLPGALAAGIALVLGAAFIFRRHLARR